MEFAIIVPAFVVLFVGIVSAFVVMFVVIGVASEYIKRRMKKIQERKK